MSFKFGNDIFNTFEKPRSSFHNYISENHISLLFRPSVIRGPCPTYHSYLSRGQDQFLQSFCVCNNKNIIMYFKNKKSQNRIWCEIKDISAQIPNELKKV